MVGLGVLDLLQLHLQVVQLFSGDGKAGVHIRRVSTSEAKGTCEGAETTSTSRWAMDAQTRIRRWKGSIKLRYRHKETENREGRKTGYRQGCTTSKPQGVNKTRCQIVVSLRFTVGSDFAGGERCDVFRFLVEDASGVVNSSRYASSTTSPNPRPQGRSADNAECALRPG